MDLDQQIANGNAVARFMNDATIHSVFEERSRLYYEQWKSSDNPDTRERIWAQARALDDLWVVLQAVVDSGDRAKYEAQRT